MGGRKGEEGRREEGREGVVVITHKTLCVESG